MNSAYPEAAAARDRWILTRRDHRNAVDPHRPYAFHLEEERAESGEVVSVATLFLTNRECPWRCLMCDLWKNTLPESVPVGAIPAQIDFALQALGTRTAQAARGSERELRGPGFRGPAPARHLKLYNSGSFFDPQAIPIEDHPAIAARVRRFERVIVEAHPSLVGESALRFRDLLAEQASSLSASRQLEIAMGLETAHPEVLEKLNKRMTLEQFKRAAAFLQEHGIALRAFILVKPPFLDESEALHWAKRSLDFAFDCGATVASLIPTRPGNGALEALAGFSPPKLATLEAAAEYGINLGRGRVFADLWNLEVFSDCAACFPARCTRLHEMNLRQANPPSVSCPICPAKGGSDGTPAQSREAGYV